MTTDHEKRLAIREGMQNTASDEYFSARSESLDTLRSRAIFESGFVRGYDAATEPLLTQHDAQPVAWMDAHQPWDLYKNKPQLDAVALYTHPAPKQVPLTDEQIDTAIAELGLNYLAKVEGNRSVLHELCRRDAHGITGDKA